MSTYFFSGTLVNSKTTSNDKNMHSSKLQTVCRIWLVLLASSKDV